SRRLVQRDAQALAKLGSQAAAAGNRPQAQKLISEALRRDPNNAHAVAMNGQLTGHPVVAMADEPVGKPPGKTAVKPAAGDDDNGDFNMVGPAPVPPAPANALDDFQRLRDLRIQQFTADVNRALASARAMMANNPAAVADELQRW